MEPPAETPDLAACVARAHERREDVRAQLDAAYACDSAGAESEAILFYDAAWALGVPEELKAAFLIGYGSTLKNEGRLDESEARLREAMAFESVRPAARAFLALTKLQAEDEEDAVAELIELLLEVGANEPSLLRYEKALRFYAKELRRDAEP